MVNVFVELSVKYVHYPLNNKECHYHSYLPKGSDTYDAAIVFCSKLL